ncbi:MAG: sulfite exporter TauE/SafE family protein [Clostridiales bacterium]|nr:sulfite exporter TauE/SafE family protein [Clostridiales bacterium]
MADFLIFILIGVLSGILSSMGVGGGSVSILLLSVFMGVGQHEAQLTNLIIFIIPAIYACIKYTRYGIFNKRTALIFALSGIPFAVAASYFASRLNNDVMRKIFGGFLVIVGVWEIICYFKDKRKRITGTIK